MGRSLGVFFLLVVFLAFWDALGFPWVRLARALEAVGFAGALVVFFLLMVWVELGSVVVVFGWVISVAIVLRVRRLHDVDDVLRVQLALVSRCVVGGSQLSPVHPLRVPIVVAYVRVCGVGAGRGYSCCFPLVGVECRLVPVILIPAVPFYWFGWWGCHV